MSSQVKAFQVSVIPSSSTALWNKNTIKATPLGGSSHRQDGGSTGEETEEEEVPVGEKEMDVIGLERKQMIVDVLVLPLLPK